MKFARPLFLALAATAAATLAPVASAQVGLSPVPVVAPGNTLLTVTAEGQSLRKPDLAVFNAGVTTQGKTAQEALSANARAMNQVIASLKRAGIAARDIQTSNLSVSPVYSNPEREAMMAARTAGQPYVPPPEPVARIIGYNASNNVMVRQRKLGDYGQVIDTLVAAGANQINGPSFQMDDPDPAMDEARLDAMRKARQRADLYARAAGLRVLRVLSITEGGGYYPRPQVAFARMEAASAPPPPPSPIEAGELQIGANVTVLYELTP